MASVFYGHEKVYLIAGENKLEKDYDSALWRARNIASPLNAKRLGVNTPCAVKGGTAVMTAKARKESAGAWPYCGINLKGRNMR